MPYDLRTNIETFKVSVSIKVEKTREYTLGPAESVSYSQEFEIPARGFSGVAKILGDLDKALGTIMKDNPLPSGTQTA